VKRGIIMATLVEKEVLIEIIGNVVASVAYTVDVDNSDLVSLLRLQDKLYGMSPERKRTSIY